MKQGTDITFFLGLPHSDTKMKHLWGGYNLLRRIFHGVTDDTLDVVAVMALDLIKESERLVLDDF